MTATLLLLVAARSWGPVFGLLGAAAVVLLLGAVALVVARRGR